MDSGGPSESCARWGSDSPKGKGQFGECPSPCMRPAKQQTLAAARGCRLIHRGSVSRLQNGLARRGGDKYVYDAAFRQNSLASCRISERQQVGVDESLLVNTAVEQFDTLTRKLEFSGIVTDFPALWRHFLASFSVIVVTVGVLSSCPVVCVGHLSSCKCDCSTAFQ